VSDLLLKNLEDGTCDLDFDSVSLDLKTSDSLFNCVTLSLGTFAREKKLEKVISNLNPSIGGWWGDSLNAEYNLGSNVYEAIPGKSVDSSLKDVERLSKDALQWLVDDGIAQSVGCSAKFEGSVIVIGVVIAKPSGEVAEYSYELNWEATSEV